MEEAGYLPALDTRFVPVPTEALLYLLANFPSRVVLLFPTSLPPKGFRALLGTFTMAVGPNPSQLYAPLWRQTWQTPEHPGKDSSTHTDLSLHQGTSSEACPPLTISKAPADAALLLLSRHTACLVARACGSTSQAVSIP